jgi:hypothetical protein
VNLTGPVDLTIEKQAFVSLTGAETYRYLFRSVEGFSADRLMSFRSGYARVSGHNSRRHVNGSVTLALAVLEHLNILDVITADRVVADIQMAERRNHGQFLTRTSHGHVQSSPSPFRKQRSEAQR